MVRRPISVTVIAWLLIVIGVSILLGIVLQYRDPAIRTAMATRPIPLPLQFALSIANGIIQALSGALMLRGIGWSRIVYIVWQAIILVIAFATFPLKPYPGLLVYAVILVFLLRKDARAYFSRSSSSEELHA